MKIAVLNFNHAVMSSVIGPFDILNKTNAFLDSFYPGNNYPRLHVSVLDTANISPALANKKEIPSIVSDSSIQKNVNIT